MPRDKRWWNESKSQPVHEQIESIVLQLIDDDPRRRYYRQWRDLYTDEPGRSEVGTSTGRTRRHRDNLIASLVDAAHAKQVKQRPRPQILTSEGDTVQQHKAKLLTEWVSGQYEHLDIYEEVTELAALDSKLVGTGIAKIYAKDGAPCVDLCYAEELFLDPREQRNNAVMTIYHARSVDRLVLAGEYPKHKKTIMEAPNSPLEDSDEHTGVEEMADLVLVVEAWRLPASKTRPEDHPGRHVIIVAGAHGGEGHKGATLRHKEYTKTKFPFRKLTWKPRPRSWFGIGIVEGSAGTQQELNDLTATISDSYRLCVPMVIVPTGTKFNRKMVTNEPWAYYTCDGDPNMIRIVVPNAIGQDFTQREDRLIARGFERHRISQMSAEGKKPAGLNSGKAQIVHNDIESENHIVSNRAYERFCVEIGEALIEVAEDLVKAAEKRLEAGETKENVYKDLKLETYAGKDALKAIDYRDVRLADHPMVMRAYPVSSLAQTPQGRYEQVADMMEAGLVDADTALELMDNPDLAAKNKRRMAARSLIDRMLDEALASGKRSSELVNRYMDLEYARKQAHLTYCEGLFNGSPDSHLQAVEEICGAIKTEFDNMAAEQVASQAAAQAGASPPPAAPPALPGAPPPEPPPLGATG